MNRCACDFLFCMLDCTADKDDTLDRDTFRPSNHMSGNDVFVLANDALNCGYLLSKHDKRQLGAHLSNSVDSRSEFDVLSAFELNNLLVVSLDEIRLAVPHS